MREISDTPLYDDAVNAAEDQDAGEVDAPERELPEEQAVESDEGNVQASEEVVEDVEVPEPEEDTEPHDDEDIPMIMEREFVAGSGFENEHELPESDFEGFPVDDVEKEEQ